MKSTTKAPSLCSSGPRRNDDAEGTLDTAPYRVEVDAKTSDGAYKATLDLSKFDPEKELTLFMRTTDEPGTLKLRDPATGELVGEAKLHGTFKDNLGTHYVSKATLNPGVFEKLELVTDFSPGGWMVMLMCGEVVVQRGDSGAGSLRQAVQDVQNNGSVCFDPVEFASPQGGPVQLGGEILVGKSVHVHGTNSASSRVEAGSQDRVLQFGIGTDGSLYNLGLSDGTAAEGGLIKNRGRLRIEECDFQSGEADRGGAIYSDGEVWMENMAATD